MTDYTAEQTFNTGDRVELHPGCDLWMQGAKYGIVTGRSIDVYLVKLDHPAVRGLKGFTADRLRKVTR